MGSPLAGLARTMAAVTTESRPADDNAGSELCRLLAQVPEVESVAAVGCEELPDGTMSYGVEVFLAGGRELLIDVQAL